MLCCQILQIWNQRLKGCYFTMLAQWWQGHLSSLLELKSPASRSAMIRMGYHPASQICLEISFAGKIHKTIFIRVALRRLPRPCPIRMALYYLIAESYRLNLDNIYIWRYCLIIHPFNKCLLSAIYVPGAVLSAGLEKWRRQSPWHYEVDILIGVGVGSDNKLINKLEKFPIVLNSN